MAALDLDRCMANLNLSLPHYREAVRIYTVINHMESATISLDNITRVEGQIRIIEIGRTTISAVTKG